MLIANNKNHIRVNVHFNNFKEVLENPIYPERGANTEMGIAIVKIEKDKYELGFSYTTASGRTIISTYNKIYCFNMDESYFLRDDIEHIISEKLKKTSESVEYIEWTIDRPLDNEYYEEHDMELSVPVGYFINTYVPNDDLNIMLLKIERKLLYNNETIKQNIIFDDSILDIKMPKKPHVYEMAALASIERDMKKNAKMQILENICKKILD